LAKYAVLGKRRVRFAIWRFDVNITVPADHVMEATGELMNRSEVFTSSKRYELAQKRLTNL
jgi:hypothetical protein